MRQYRILIIAIGIFLFFNATVFGAVELEPAGMLAQGEEWETPYYVIDSNLPGPTIFIIGGTHGGELAGWQTALELLKRKPDRGKFIIVPKANKKGVELRYREIEGEGNLNRCYPGKEDGIPMEQMAFHIFSLIKETQPDLVLDLHESREFHLIDEKYVGQTLIASPDDMTLWIGMCVIDVLNEEITEEVERFTLLQGPVKGSTVWAVGKFTQIPAFTVETSRKMELSSRINYQISVVKYMLKEFEVELLWDM